MTAADYKAVRDVGARLDEAPDLDPVPVLAGAVEEMLSLATDGPGAVADRRHQVSQLLLEVELTDDVLAAFATADHRDAWSVLAETVTPLARTRCVEMAMWCDLDLPRDSA